MAQHNDLGKEGELMASDYLVSKGYTIRAKNYRFQKAEVDILAQKGGVLAAIEVKTRSTLNFGTPQDFVKPQQIKNLVKVVDAYIQEFDLDLEVRFDIVAIIKSASGVSIKHLEDAFYHF